MNNKRKSQPGYIYLKVYQFLMIIFDLTDQFTKRFLISPEHRRTRDQYYQAARSSKQCLVEGYTQEGLKGYIKLAGISHGSNEELKEDYKDFLRQRNLPVWPKDHPKLGKLSWVSRACREIAEGKTPTIPPLPTDPTDPTNPTHSANLLLDLTTKAGFILEKLITSLEEKHRTEGGLTEKLYWRRVEFRKSKEKP